jgi:hypothetical protein
MRLKLILAGIIGIACSLNILAYKEIVIENFANGKINRWKPKRKAEITLELDKKAGTLKVNLPPKGVNWVFCFLKNPIDLNKYPYFQVTLRALKPGLHKYYFYIKKDSKEKGAQSFYTILCLKGDKFHTFTLDSRWQGRNSRDATKGYFVYSKGKIRSLKAGGELNQITFTSTLNGADFEIKSIKMLSALPSSNSQNKAKQDIKSVTLQAPYKFKHIYSGKELVIADNGKSDYKIAIPGKADATIQFAAQTLQKYLQKTTGAVLEIVHLPCKGKKIELGVYNYQKNNDSFELKGKNDEITIKGRSQRALLYGVYDFLEKACGIRFFAPIKAHEIMPKIKKLTLKPFADFNSPSMTIRRFHYCSYRQTTMKRRYEAADWAFKNRFNFEGGGLHRGTQNPKYYAKLRYEFYGKRGEVYRSSYFWGHNYHKLVNPKTYFKTNPDFFCWNKRTKKYQWKNAQICTTNPKVVNVIADFAEKYFKQHPGRTIFPLFPEDGSRLWCQCPECSKLDPPGTGYSFDHMADRAIYLVNAVDKELKRRNLKDKIITFAAYQPTRIPAVKLKLTPSSLVSYCVYTDGTSDFTKPISEVPLLSSEIKTWAEKTKGNISIYNYVYLGFFYNFTTDKNIVKNYRFYNKLGIKGNVQETFEAWGFDDYLMYLGARLAWNPWIDTDLLKQDYFNKIYGKSAKPMEKFREICQNVMSDYNNYISCDLRRFPNFKPEHLAQLKECLVQAKKLAGNDQRILSAIERKEKLYSYIVLFVQTVNSAVEFFADMNEKNYKKTQELCEKLKKKIGELYKNPDGEIVAARIGRMVRIIGNSAKRLYRQNVQLKKLKGKYEIVETLPNAGWKFKKDSFNKGLKEKWEELKSYKNWRNIKTGAFWEKQGLGNYDGFGYYQKSYNLPADCKAGDKLYLYFLGVDEQAWVFVNGKLAGKHTGIPEKMWLEPFLINITPFVKFGVKNNIVVRVHDSGGGGGIWQDIVLVKAK